MPEEFEGDLAGALFWGADMTGARFRDVDLTGATISHAWLLGVDIDAWIERLVVNGVDVTDYVNERDPWYPLRTMLRPSDPAGMRATWAALDDEWATTIALAREVPEESLHVSVDGEWSFVETLRHIVFAIDKWFTAPILGEPFDPMGLSNTGSADFPFPGIDTSAQPSVADALASRADRAARVAVFLESVTIDDFTRSIDVPENGPHPLVECIYTVFEEPFWHNRYARRDLEILRAGT
jgi:hypothetical protein